MYYPCPFNASALRNIENCVPVFIVYLCMQELIIHRFSTSTLQCTIIDADFDQPLEEKISNGEIG